MQTAASTAPAIDVHTHLAPLLDSAFLRQCDVTADAGGRFVVAGRPVGPLPLYDPAQLLCHLDDHALDQAFVSVPPPFFRQDLTTERKSAWVDAINAGVIAACDVDDRLKPLAYLPLEDPVVAVRVVRARLASDEFIGWVAAAGGRSVPLGSPELAEVWHLLAADGRPMILHPAESPDARLTPHYLHNLLGNPVETGLAAAELVFGGVLAANPHLRIVLVHCGGVVPSVAARWQRGLETARPGVDPSLPSVATQLQRIYTDCLTHDAANLDLARHVFGDNRLLLGSDWPFPMGLEDPREPVRHLSPALQEQITRLNPRTLTSVRAASLSNG